RAVQLDAGIAAGAGKRHLHAGGHVLEAQVLEAQVHRAEAALVQDVDTDRHAARAHVRDHAGRLLHGRDARHADPQPGLGLAIERKRPAPRTPTPAGRPGARTFATTQGVCCTAGMLGTRIRSPASVWPSSTRSSSRISAVAWKWPEASASIATLPPRRTKPRMREWLVRTVSAVVKPVASRTGGPPGPAKPTTDRKSGV